jgi:hypothetical protein
MNVKNIESQLLGGEAESKPIYQAPEVINHRVSQVVQGDGSKDPDALGAPPGLTGPL